MTDQQKLTELTNAAAALLKKIDSITTEEFSQGDESQEREALRSILAEIGVAI